MSQYTLLRHIEPELQFGGGYVVLNTKAESSAVAFDVIDGNIMVNMTDLKKFCEREDVSLSESERADLLCRIEGVIEPCVNCEDGHQ